MAKANAALSRGDYAEALRLNFSAAELGDPQAQNNLGAFYTDGMGVVVPNAEEAMKWYRLAASGGNVQAKKNIGDLYVAATVPPNCKDKLSGAVSLGCFWVADPNDNAKFLDAMKWYQEAALAGHAGAMTNIGWLYASGYGVKQDCGLAKQWLVKAAAGGNQSAVNNLKSGIGRCSW